MHVESLKKGDIVLNHLQTKALLKHGSAPGHGRIVGGSSAFAHGTAQNGIPSYAWSSVNSRGSLGGLTQTATAPSGPVYNNDGDVNNYYGDTSNDYNYSPYEPPASSSDDDSSDDGIGFGFGSDDDSESSNGEKKFSYEVIDYVAIRLEYFANKTKEVADKITDYVTTAVKGTLLKDEIKSVKNEIQVNSRAATAYMEKADEISKTFAYADDDGNKKTIKLTDRFDLKKLISGGYNLKDYDTSTKKDAAYVDAAKQYNEYYNKAVEANQAVQTLSNSMRELYSSLINLPTDKLSKALDKLNNKLKTFASMSNAMSSGGSGINSIQRMYNSLIKNPDDKKLKKATAQLEKAEKKNAKNEATVKAAKKTSKKANKKSTDSANTVLDTAKKALLKKAKNTDDTDAAKYLKKALKKNGKLDVKKIPSELLSDVKSWNYLINQTSSDKTINTKKTGKLLKKLNEKDLKKYNKNAKKAQEADSDLAKAKKKLNKTQAQKNEAQKAVDNAKSVSLPQSTNLALNADVSKPAYITQNKILKADLKASKTEVKSTYKALKEENQVYKELKKDNKAYKKNLKKSKNKLLKSKGLTKEQKEAIKNGENIDAKTVPASLSKMVGEYNKFNSLVNTTSSAIKESKDKMTELKEQTAQSISDLAEKEQEYSKQRLANIDAYYSASAEFYNSLADKIGAKISLNEELGRDAKANGKLKDNVTVNDYIKEIKELENVRATDLANAEAQQKDLKKQLKEGTMVEGTQEYLEAKKRINDLKTEATKTAIEIDKLYDAAVDVRLKPFTEAIEQINFLLSQTQTLRNMITEDMMYTKDGSFTEMGVAALTMDMNNYKNAQKDITKYKHAITELTSMYENHELQLSAEEYYDKLQELQKGQMNALVESNNARQSIIKSVSDRYKTEIDYIDELIDARKKEIQKQKEMYNYDRNLSKQTKEIAYIEQQIRALETLTDTESKAQKARLEAQLQEKQETLKDTVTEHVADLRVDALNDLSEDLRLNFEKFVKDLAINIDDDVKLINDVAITLNSTLSKTNTTLDNFLKTFNPYLLKSQLGMTDFTYDNTTSISKINPQNAANAIEHYNDNYSAKEYEYYKSIKGSQSTISTNTQTIADILKGVPGHASGTMRAKGGLSKVNENGPETIVTKSGVFMPLSHGDAVIPSGLTANLIKMAETGMNKTLAASVYKVPEFNTTNNVSNQSHFDNLLNINVEGNLDSSVVPQLEQIAKGLQNNRLFMNGIYEHTAKAMSKDLRKAR